MLDRVLAPQTVPITDIPLLDPQVSNLSNGLPVYTINTGTQEVVKIDLWFNSGAVNGAKANHAAAVVDLLREGTRNYSAKQIAEALDGKGAFLETQVYKERSSVTLYCLTKFAKQLLPLLAEVVLEPSFAPEEISTYAAKKAQKLQTDLEKVGTLASRAFSTNLFGFGHSYGRLSEVEDWQKLDRSDLISHHQNIFVPSLHRVMISGRITENLTTDIEAVFGSVPVEWPKLLTEFSSERASELIQVKKTGVVQNAIKLGRPMFNRIHPDFVGMQVLTTILGGYFGSRLMSNIREDKGYTYGINAGLQSLNETGYLMISTEVGSDVSDATLKEVESELISLCNEPIPDQELELVKNYLMGQLLKSVDGPFSLSTKWNALLNFGLGVEEHHSRVEEMRAISSSRLQQLAQSYLNPDMMMTVVAGRI